GPPLVETKSPRSYRLLAVELYSVVRFIVRVSLGILQASLPTILSATTVDTKSLAVQEPRLVGQLGRAGNVETRKSSAGLGAPASVVALATSAAVRTCTVEKLGLASRKLPIPSPNSRSACGGSRGGSRD